MKLSELIKKLEAFQKEIGPDAKVEVYNAAHETHVQWNVSIAYGDVEAAYRPIGVKKGQAFVEFTAD